MQWQEQILLQYFKYFRHLSRVMKKNSGAESSLTKIQNINAWAEPSEFLNRSLLL